MVVVPIRGDNAYIGLAKQTSGQGVAAAPTLFPRWLDGSSLEFDTATSDVWEGDGSRRLSQVIKTRQSVKVKLVFNPRPVELGFVARATMGQNSDSLVGPTDQGGTLNAGVTGGTSTSIVVASGYIGGSSLVTPASGSIQLAIGSAAGGTSGYEVATFTLPATGTGPWTLNVAAGYNSGKIKNTYASASPVNGISTINTSLTSAALANATTIVVGNQLGISGTPIVMLDPGLSTEEIVTINASSVTGTGPWTYTLANSGTLKYAHSSGAIVISPVGHTLTDQADGDYYTVEVCIGGLSGGAGPTLRVRDCKVNSLKRSSKAGELLTYEVELQGIATTSTGAPATVTLENHSPFFYTSGAWTLNGSTTGDALQIDSFDITQKNNLDTSIQTEAITLAAIIFGNVQVDVAISIVMQNANLINLTYFGSASGTTDAQAIGAGSLIVTFSQVDGFHSVQYTLSTLHYTKTGVPQPKKDGKAFRIPISASSVSNAGANTYVLQEIIYNGQAQPY